MHWIKTNVNHKGTYTQVFKPFSRWTWVSQSPRSEDVTGSLPNANEGINHHTLTRLHPLPDSQWKTHCNFYVGLLMPQPNIAPMTRRRTNLLKKSTIKFHDVRAFVAAHDNIEVHQQLLLLAFVHRRPYALQSDHKILPAQPFLLRQTMRQESANIVCDLFLDTN